jgi:serine/threonine-protein kinase SRPK3
MLDSFEHVGPNGKRNLIFLLKLQDVCMVFEVLGSNLLDLIKRYNYRGIPIPIVKNLCKNILTGIKTFTKC